MSRTRGIRVPSDPNALTQWYRESTVTERFDKAEARDARYDQLVSLRRRPIRGTTYDDGKTIYFIRWVEPRHPELAELGENI